MFHGFLLPRGPRKSPEERAAATRRYTPRATDVARRFTVRLAEPRDAQAVRAIAELDCARVPEGTLLVGELGGAIQAVLPVAGGVAIANPFVRTVELVNLLELRAGQLRELGVSDSAAVIPLPRRRPSFAGRVA